MVASQVNTTVLNSLDGWIDTYKILARKHLAALEDGSRDKKEKGTGRGDGSKTGSQHVHARLRRRLNADCESLLGRRKANLRDSGDYALNKVGATIAGGIPFARTWATNELGRDFARRALAAFGLGDGGRLRAFQRSFQGAFNSRSQMARDMAWTAAEQMAQGLLKGVALEEVASEAVHVKPVVGQMLSMGMGYHRMRKKMLQILEAAAKKAEMLHKGLVIPHVIHLMRYVVGDLPGGGVDWR